LIFKNFLLLSQTMKLSTW